MSGAFLYLAIVAIWVCVLVPRWVRRSHSADARDSLPVADPAEADDAADDLTDGETSVWIETFEAQATVASVTVTGDPASLAAALDAPALDAAALDAVRRGAARPPLSRARVLQARRRLLTMLVVLTVGTAACMVVGLTPWWFCVPPVALMGLYLLLLREAALADAENSRRRHQASQALVARERAAASLAAEQDWTASLPQPAAEVIDISALVRDQLYDQYADATVRAVGD